MPAEGRENPLLKKGNSDAFFREKYLTKNKDICTLAQAEHWALIRWLLNAFYP